MDSLKRHLDDAWKLFDRACRHLKGRAIDDVQIELYDLAFSLAELVASRVMLEYSQRPAESDEQALKQAVTESFIAEAVASLHSRIRLRPHAYGFKSTELDNGYLALMDVALDPKKLAKLGQLFRDRDGRLPIDHLDEERTLMRSSFRQFAEEQVVPLAEKIHREDLLVPDSIIEGVRELGCFGLSVPERYGGLKPDEEEDSLGMVVVTEELSRASLGAAGSLITRPEIMARSVLEGGTDEQKQRWLPGIARGDPLVAISVTEPGTGSDVASVALRATPTQGGWLLNGGKTWCTFAGKAGAILVLARSEPDVTPPHRGLSLFVVEKPEFDGQSFEFESPGGGRLSGQSIATLGYRGLHSFEMFYDDFFVPEENLVGGEGGRGKGFYFTMRGFSGGRLQTAARASGLMQASFEAALSYAEQRRVFGRVIADYPLTLQKIGRMGATITAVRQFGYVVAGLMDRDKGQIEASLVKLFACKAAEWITREALQIHGGLGYAEETPVSRYFVDARVLSIFEGAEETLALRVVGKSLLEKGYATF